MFVDLLILNSLINGPSYGYEIKKNVARFVGGTLVLNNNALYPALRKFEQMGAVEKEVERQEGKPDKHLYRATGLGREIFMELLREFPPERAKHDVEFLVRVAFLHLLEAEERARILEVRRTVLEGLLAHLSAVQPHAEGSGYPYAVRVVGFRRAQVELELDWIAQLESGVTA